MRNIACSYTNNKLFSNVNSQFENNSWSWILGDGLQKRERVCVSNLARWSVNPCSGLTVNRPKARATLAASGIDVSCFGIFENGIHNVHMLRDQLYEAFRKSLVDARQKNSLTQQDVALRLGRPQSFVSKYESGERRLDVIEFMEICHAIGVSPQSILKKLKVGDD